MNTNLNFSISLSEGESLDEKLLHIFPHLFTGVKPPLSLTKSSTPNEKADAAYGLDEEKPKQPSDEELLELVNRAIKAPKIGLSRVQAILKSLGAEKISMLSDAQKVVFAETLKIALGESVGSIK
jgi:hypothetical protein